MKKLLTCALLTLCLLTTLTACGQSNTDGAEKDAPAVSEEQSISGIVNRLDDYLVLLDGDEYHIFDFGEDVDTSSLEEGDSVTVTYTGTLDSEDPVPVATAIEKTA